MEGGEDRCGEMGNVLQGTASGHREGVREDSDKGRHWGWGHGGKEYPLNYTNMENVKTGWVLQ